ncbi:hypothetical protein TNCV_5085661 [Trichonephila clavipes]|uniref:Uncharacterized protein n=1 Tax=Trichonephila clavipes TaxID=2585209 RepID=A0A8X6S7Z9_TRICX|nr:hypothetical protein TNCV_5085661 [Trichonephila clavipes]
MVLSIPSPCIDLTDSGDLPEASIEWTKLLFISFTIATVQENLCSKGSAMMKLQSMSVNIKLFSDMRAFGDEPHHFEPWSSDEDDT